MVNKNQAMKYGLTVAQVYQQISAKLTKESAATTLSENGSSMDVVVENSTSKAFTREDLENMKLKASGSAGSSGAGGGSGSAAASGGSMSGASGSSAGGCIFIDAFWLLRGETQLYRRYPDDCFPE